MTDANQKPLQTEFTTKAEDKKPAANTGALDADNSALDRKIQLEAALRGSTGFHGSYPRTLEVK